MVRPDQLTGPLAMAQGKIEPLIEAAENRAKERSKEDIHALINAIDEQINELEKQMELKIVQIAAAIGERLDKLEKGVTPQASA